MVMVVSLWWRRNIYRRRCESVTKDVCIDRCVYAFPSDKRLEKPNTYHVFGLLTTEDDVTEKDIVTHISHTFSVRVIPTTQKTIEYPIGAA